MRAEELKQAKELAEAGELDQAWAICEKYLNNNPDDSLALLLASFVMDKANKPSVAWHFARRVTELEPEKFAGWHNRGRTADKLWMVEEAERCFRKSLKFAATEKDKSHALTNLAALFIQLGEFAKAEPVCRNALSADPGYRKARANLGFCQLAARNWAEGWDNYAFCLGNPTRKKIQYDNEPEWDGAKGLKVAIYGEQGLGDEISFASMIPDAIRDCEKIVIDCDLRLKNLFQRSFPETKVYGTRGQGHAVWDEPDTKINASIAMGGLGGLYRTSADSFPKLPYLVPDPDRVTMWKALWESKKKPAIGIAWTGGLRHTGSDFRQWTLEDLLPLFDSIDAHWVCLQYKDSAAEISAFRDKHGIDLVQYPYATLTQDYDDTAALVASLDRVVSMQTAVVHLCGALGKRCDVFVPRNSQWRYGEGFTTLPWYSSVNVIRQAVRGHWKNTIDEYAQVRKAA